MHISHHKMHHHKMHQISQNDLHLYFQKLSQGNTQDAHNWKGHKPLPDPSFLVRIHCPTFGASALLDVIGDTDQLPIPPLDNTQAAKGSLRGILFIIKQNKL